MSFHSSRACLLGMALVLGACTSVPPTTLTGMQNAQVRALTMECFQRNEGLATVYGSWEILVACRERARAIALPKGF